MDIPEKERAVVSFKVGGLLVPMRLERTGGSYPVNFDFSKIEVESALGSARLTQVVIRRFLGLS